MGSCISKCKPMKKHLPPVDLSFVQDKLVISQPPPLTLTPSPLSLSNKISPYPPSPSPSSSSLSSFTCVSSNTTTSTNTSLSSISSATSNFVSKHRYFSDEFLRSRYNENPHVVRISSLKASTLPSPARRNVPAKPVSPAGRHPSPKRVPRSPSQKRVRSASPAPNMTRQKSFRKDQLSSPCRSFNGERSRVVPKRIVGLKEITETSGSIISNNIKLKKETIIHRISSKIDQTGVGEALAIQELDTVIPMEDIDNPLISLDCFIFL